MWRQALVGDGGAAGTAPPTETAEPRVLPAIDTRLKSAIKTQAANGFRARRRSAEQLVAPYPL
eukprot:6586255-Prorocentrum_lima.AAC.1